VIINKKRLSDLPEKPGIYIFKNRKHEAIYVGKAKNIKKRVRTYFYKSKDSRRNIDFLMQEADDLDFISTKTEEDALLLENRTIKNKQPKYNILLKDDKTYASLRLEINKLYPRISIARKCDDKESIYLGPFKSSQSLYETKRLIQKLFGVRDCTDAKFNRHKDRACIFKNIGLCLGPCDETGLEKDYVTNIDFVVDIFKGKVAKLKQQIKSKMELMAKEERFEEAAFYRDQFETLKNNPVFDTKSLQKVSNLDVVGFASSKNRVQIIILFIRGGYIIDKADLFFTSKTKQLEIEIYQLISQFYSKQISTPDGILLSNEFQYLTELKEDLLAIGLKKINIQIPKKGKKNKLIELAKNNAEDHIKNNIKSEKETNLTLSNLKNIMSLHRVPKRIECFDISNTQGTNPVGSMVTFINGKPQKSFYRKFKVKSKGPNDYTMMEEVVSRRLKRIGQNGWEKPDLILIDGGKGHLNRISKILNSDINIASIAKPRKNEKTDKIYLPNQKKPADFKDNIEEFGILVRARDEAHRFAITFHKSKRNKEMFS
tara:strand:- start:1853 stop:3484 length:1632 start_codon:yes stop_codon:yes gene_type:complete